MGIERSKAAKKMVDEGGQEVEDRLLAKHLGNEGVSAENAAMASLKLASQKLREAEAKLRSESVKLQNASATDAREVVEQVEWPECEKLAEAYAARAQKIESFLESIYDDLERPVISGVE